INDYRKSDSIKRKLISHSENKHRASEEASRFIIKKATDNANLQKGKSDLLLRLLLLASLLIVTVVLFFWHKNKKAKANFEQIIALHERAKSQNGEVPLGSTTREPINDVVLSTEKEAQLLHKLTIFEAGVDFTEK